jgi:sugar/nucleoside kinase (ribokinase family)
LLDVLCVGEALWDLYAPAGVPFAEAPSLAFVPGGAAVNVALHLTRLGLRAGLAAVVGEDALGEALIARVAGLGVECSRVERAPPRTGLVFVERAGEARRIVGYRAKDERAPKVSGAIEAKLLFLTGVLPDEAAIGGFADMAAHARRGGARVVLDLNARRGVWAGRAAPLLGPLFEAADVIRCSTDDLALLACDVAAVQGALREGGVLMVSDGPRPTRAFGPFGVLERAPDHAEVLDPTGAGDALSAGVLAELCGAEGSWREAALWERAIDRGHALARAHLCR